VAKDIRRGTIPTPDHGVRGFVAIADLFVEIAGLHPSFIQKKSMQKPA
jgi:hypothetical protein